MSLLDYKAHYVNLSHRADRNDHMAAQLGRIGLEAERFEALKPSDWRGDNRKIAAMLNRTPGAIGCYLSQVACIRKSYDAGKHAMVLEDDVLFADDFMERLAVASEYLSGRDWAVFWLGGTCHADATWAKENGTETDMKRTDHPNVVRTFGAFSTHGYIVNQPHIPEVMRRLSDGMHRHWGIDHGMILDVQPVMPCYGFIPGMLYQMDNESDIGVDQRTGKKGVTVFSHFVRILGAYCWQPGKMSDFNAAEFTARLPKE